MLKYGSNEFKILQKEIVEKLKDESAVDESLAEVILLQVMNKMDRPNIKENLSCFIDEEKVIDVFLDWLFERIGGEKEKEKEKEEDVVISPSLVEGVKKKKETTTSPDSITGHKRKREETDKVEEMGVVEKKRKIEIKEGKVVNPPELEEKRKEKEGRIIDLSKKKSRFEFLANKPLISGKRHHPNMSWRRIN